jgi:hypothetical protein
MSEDSVRATNYIPQASASDLFHTHLDQCAQCREHPFDLCAEGAILIMRAGSDIHKSTAARALGINLDEVTEETRRVAKAVNFGLMFGRPSR